MWWASIGDRLFSGQTSLLKHIVTEVELLTSASLNSPATAPRLCQQVCTIARKVALQLQKKHCSLQFATQPQNAHIIMQRILALNALQCIHTGLGPTILSYAM